MSTSHTSPDIRNYYIGKGTIEFKKVGALDYRFLGNAPDFEFKPEVTKLEHFSSMAGVKKRDRTVVTEKKASVTLTLEEWTPENLALILLGSITQNTDGRDVIEIFSENAISGSIRFTGTNEVGPRYEIVLPLVDFVPGDSLSPISQEYGQLKITGDVQTVDGSFGTTTDIGEEDSE